VITVLAVLVSWAGRGAPDPAADPGPAAPGIRSEPAASTEVPVGHGRGRPRVTAGPHIGQTSGSDRGATGPSLPSTSLPSPSLPSIGNPGASPQAGRAGSAVLISVRSHRGARIV